MGRTRLVLVGLAAAVAACGQPAPRPVASPTPTLAVATPPAQRNVPTHVQIPAIGVDAAVEPLGVTLDQSQSALAMAAPARPADVGWYAPGAAPGEQGDVVLDGHKDWTTGPAVFWRLAELKGGDQVELTTQGGRTFAYRVVEAKDYPWDSRPEGLFATTGRPELSLITCTGRWDGRKYLQRRVVTAIEA